MIREYWKYCKRASVFSQLPTELSLAHLNLKGHYKHRYSRRIVRNRNKSSSKRRPETPLFVLLKDTSTWCLEEPGTYYSNLLCSDAWKPHEGNQPASQTTFSTCVKISLGCKQKTEKQRKIYHLPCTFVPDLPYRWVVAYNKPLSIHSGIIKCSFQYQTCINKWLTQHSYLCHTEIWPSKACGIPYLANY